MKNVTAEEIIITSNATVLAKDNVSKQK